MLGYSPDYVAPPLSTIPLSGNLHADRRTWFTPYAVVVEIITTVLLGIRLGSRISKLGGRPGIDDVLITGGWLIGLGLTIVTIYAITYWGFELKMEDVPPNLWWRGALSAVIVEYFYLYSTACTKLSVLMFHRRLVEGTVSRGFKRAIWCAIAFVFAQTIVFSVLVLMTCSPVPMIWYQYIPQWVAAHPGASCKSPHLTVWISDLSGAVSVFSDFFSVLLPGALLLKIQISKRQKWGLMVIFGVGFLVCCAGIGRTIYLGRAVGVGDKSTNAYYAFVWAVAESHMAVICACAPSLKTVFSKFFRDIGSSRDNSKNSSKGVYDSEGPLKSGLSESTSGRRGSGVSFMRTMSFRTRGKKSSSGKSGALSSFAEAHEYGLDSFAPVVEGYDDKPPLTRLDPPSPERLEPIREHDGPNQSSMPEYTDGTPIPSATIVIQQPQNGAAAATTDAEQARPSNGTQTPGHDRGGSDGQLSFVFIDEGRDDEESLVRVRYRSFIDASSDEDNFELSFPRMNPGVTRSQSLRDERELHLAMIRNGTLPPGSLLGADPQRPSTQPQAQPPREFPNPFAAAAAANHARSLSNPSEAIAAAVLRARSTPHLLSQYAVPAATPATVRQAILAARNPPTGAVAVNPSASATNLSAGAAAAAAASAAGPRQSLHYRHSRSHLESPSDSEQSSLNEVDMADAVFPAHAAPSPAPLPRPAPPPHAITASSTIPAPAPLTITHTRSLSITASRFPTPPASASAVPSRMATPPARMGTPPGPHPGRPVAPSAFGFPPPPPASAAASSSGGRSHSRRRGSDEALGSGGGGRNGSSSPARRSTSSARPNNNGLLAGPSTGGAPGATAVERTTAAPWVVPEQEQGQGMGTSRVRSLKKHEVWRWH